MRRETINYCSHSAQAEIHLAWLTVSAVRGRLLAVVLAMAVWFTGPALTAQDFSVRHGTINSGSLAMHGDTFSIAGGAGQTVTGLSTVVELLSIGGFDQSHPPLLLPLIPTIVALNAPPNQVIITWTPHSSSFVLEFADSLNRPRWFAYSNVTNNVASAPANARQFYFRLRRINE